jgi:hypothetical protein
MRKGVIYKSSTKVGVNVSLTISTYDFMYGAREAGSIIS